ncbi:MAG: substrate-binding domain-containing protein, partial [Halobacteriota archaeon]
NGIRSPARRVAQGTATVGLGLRFAASELDVDFVPLGTQTLQVVAAPGRVEKPGVKELRTVLEADLAGIIDTTPGYST